MLLLPWMIDQTVAVKCRFEVPERRLQWLATRSNLRLVNSLIRR